MRVHHEMRRADDGEMLRRELLAPAEQHNVAGDELIAGDRPKMPRRRFGKRLAARGLGPVRRIRRRALRLVTDDVAPHAADQAEAIAADALERGLVPIRRADPAPRFGDDVQLLRSQSERCRDILRRLTTLSAEDEEHMRLLPLSSLLEEVMAPHREFGIKLTLIEESGRAGEPIGYRNAGILYGLGNLLENAVDHAREEVTVTVSHTADQTPLDRGIVVKITPCSSTRVPGSAGLAHA